MNEELPFSSNQCDIEKEKCGNTELDIFGILSVVERDTIFDALRRPLLLVLNV